MQKALMEHMVIQYETWYNLNKTATRVPCERDTNWIGVRPVVGSVSSRNESNWAEMNFWTSLI